MYFVNKNSQKLPISTQHFCYKWEDMLGKLRFFFLLNTEMDVSIVDRLLTNISYLSELAIQHQLRLENKNNKSCSFNVWYQFVGVLVFYNVVFFGFGVDRDSCLFDGEVFSLGIAISTFNSAKFLFKFKQNKQNIGIC